MNLKIDLKNSDIIKEIKDNIKEKINKDLKKVAAALAKEAQKKAEEFSRKDLPKDLDEKYRENIFVEQISENITFVGIRKEALWIEKGRKSGFMEELLNGPKAKMSKDGTKYNIIPFEHKTSSGPSRPNNEDAIGDLKKFLRSKGVGTSKTRALEMDGNGSPRIGKIRSFDIKDMRNKAGKNLSNNLQGVSVYQNMNPRTGKVERNIMTFRVISEKHKGTGKWEHPGTKGEGILPKVHKHLQETWQRQILPDLKRKYKGKQ